MQNRTGNLSIVLILLLILAGTAPPIAEAIGTTIRNIPPTRHLAPAGTPLDNIAAAIRLAAKEEHWVIVAESSGVMQASLRVRTHKAVVEIGFDESNFWIEYRDSFNLDYNPNDLRRLSGKRIRIVKGPRIHKNYNRWVEELAASILDRVKNPPRSDLTDTAPAKPAVFIADEIEKLDALRERGVLTQEEFDQQKAKLLAQ